MDAAKEASYAEVRPIDKDRLALNHKEAAMRSDNGREPEVLMGEEITEQDFEILLRIANSPEATKGRLTIKPRRIPIRERVALNG